jgi:hypothetical protein
MQEYIVAEQLYKKYIQEHTEQVEMLKKQTATIAWLRFGIFIASVTCFYFLWHSATAILIGVAFAAIGSFLWLLSKAANTKKLQQKTELLIQLNLEELRILQHDFFHRFDGQSFLPNEHAYANDLDIFGKASLYQYMNRCNSEQGQQLFAQQLLHAQTTQQIIQQQEAAKELSTNINWMQAFLALGSANQLTIATQTKINEWIQQPITSVKWSGWKWFINIYSLVTISSLVLHIVDVIPASIFYFSTLLYFLFAMVQSKKAHATYLLLNKVVNEVSTLYEQLNSIENNPFKSHYFTQIQQQLQQASPKKAANEILDLKNILDRFDMRLNVFVFFFLNSFLLWDARQMLALNAWKQKHTNDINNWFLAIASTEVSISIAILHFNQPNFCFPTISPTHFEFKATNLGHPLIQSNKCVSNNFSQNGTGNIALITGSNMGGKSTFLRSVGINSVLALMGAPVCATEFTIANVELMSSMRIADNLAESTSTFYAELKKLQVIIEAVKQQRKVFVLLDEILRGTNSFDRHTGSKALIQQFIKQNAVAIIATHDVELAALENQFPTAMHNYHFDVQVANEELYFDYKLKNGICTSLNASILMKKIGIEMN